MITMRVECAIGVEPMNSTLCRREPCRLATRTRLPGMDSNHHVACFRGRWATDYPTRQRKESARQDSNLRPRGSKPLTLTRLRYSPKKLVAALATGTALASPRTLDEASSKSKHDDGSSRTLHDSYTRSTVGQSSITSFLSVTGV